MQEIRESRKSGKKGNKKKQKLKKVVNQKVGNKKNLRYTYIF